MSADSPFLRQGQASIPQSWRWLRYGRVMTRVGQQPSEPDHACAKANYCLEKAESFARGTFILPLAFISGEPSLSEQYSFAYTGTPSPPCSHHRKNCMSVRVDAGKSINCWDALCWVMHSTPPSLEGAALQRSVLTWPACTPTET